MFSLIDKKPVILRSIEAFEEADGIDEIVVIANIENIQKIFNKTRHFHKVKAILTGGKDRRHSVLNGLSAISDRDGIIAVHDGARPLVTPRLINAVIAAAKEYGAAVPAVRIRDTVKESDGERITATLDREKLYAAQTPQAFDLELYRKAAKLDINATDDCMLIESLGVAARMVEGEYSNIKITVPTDLIIAEALIKNGVN